MPDITYDAVAEAAEKIEKAGQRVTQAAVRSALGGGSYSTIGPFLQQWRDHQSERKDLAEIEIPGTLAEAGSQWLSKIWRVATNEALAGHEVLRRELLASQAQADEMTSEHAEVVQQLELELSKLELELSKRTQRADNLEELWGQKERELQEADRQCGIAEASLKGEKERALTAERRADKAETWAEKLNGELENLRHRLEEVHAEAVSYREQVAQLGAERDGLKERLATAEKGIADAKTATVTAEARAGKAEQRTEKVEARLEAVQSELSQVQADMGTARADLATARAERAQSEDRLKLVSAELEKTQARADAIEESAS